MATVLIVGATSGIAQALARAFARQGWGLVLAGRDLPEVGRIAVDLSLRHRVPVAIVGFEATAYGEHGRLLVDWDLEGVVVCHGYLGDQRLAEVDWEEAHRIVDVNYTSYVSVLTAAAQYFEPRGRGFLCAISSVAGDRGKQSNYVYGSAKAGVTVFMQGLRNRLHRSGVRVVTVKPGFVDTAMTYGLVKRGASPEKVADAVYRGVARGRDVIYVPGLWRWIMLVIRHIPEAVFKRLRL